VSLKVLPKAEAEATLRFDLKPKEALRRLHEWGGRPLPMDASAWWNGNLVVRLRGSAASVEEAFASLGGEPIGADAATPSGTACATDRSLLRSAQDAIEHRTRPSGGCRCRRPRRCSASPATS
jgi:hypothetical protein